MSDTAVILLAAAISAGVAFAVSGLAAWCGPVDPPRARGSHAAPTPTSGGLGIMAGASLGLACFALLASRAGGYASIAEVLAFAGLSGLLGAVDDVVDLGARTKLGLQAVLAAVFALTVARIEALPLGAGSALPLGAVLGVLGTTLWIVVVTNGVNFMDGANGLASGATAVALAALGLAALLAQAPSIAAAAFAGAAAGAGFLPWNLRERLFQGDAGALFSSALFAGLAVLAAGADGRGPVFLYFGPLALLPLLTDVLLTLLWRARRGRPLFQAHRDHLYQLWLQRTGRSHRALAWRAWLATAAAAAVALIAQELAPSVQPLAFAGGVVVLTVGWYALRRRLSAPT